jgi:hypothetical protein
MKTTKKVAIGMLFLAPLFLPSQTRAGGFTDWVHSVFQQHRDNAPQPMGFRREDPLYRPYDPYSPGHGRPGDPNGNGNSVPIDGGLVFLLAAGLLLGAKRVYDGRKEALVVPVRD